MYKMELPLSSLVACHSSTQIGTERLSSSNVKLTARDERDRSERWRHILSSLSSFGSGSELDVSSRENVSMLRTEPVSGSYARCNAKIDVIEQPTSNTVVISWRDSTGGSYGYQFWFKRFARNYGRCAISGSAIAPGDEIYRPDVRFKRPLNYSAMILAVFISGPRISSGL
ncbi:DUF3331 domain-containing protein [Burkholderia cepacia]|uniref:DUF3331 domain-containing protein n=1 Tax=Burkholderia cepacia TaxID=292 RepID=UPI00158ACB6C